MRNQLNQFEVAGCLTEEVYQAAIPTDCAHQTTDSHVKMLGGCWGLMAAVRRGDKMNCGSCSETKTEMKKTMARIEAFNAKKAAHVAN